ncbi:MAG: T9SS type A sorting domain-containing protein [Candidatus Marinimicrobia bacterium]|nr:T9SS type A sorting domain-containing protein [Candidatus Neomarinimicrobiota bacterium]
MKANVTKTIVLATFLVAMLVLNGCKFETVDQPATATAGSAITITLQISTNDAEANKKWGLLGFMVPDDWTITSINYAGDFGSGTTHFLPSDSSDKYPSAVDKGWADSIEVRYPSGDLMHWVVYESDSGYTWTAKSYIDVEINVTVGNTNGTFDLGYFFTEGSLDFTNAYGSYWCDTLSNSITVTGGSATKNENLVVNKFSLSQNFPNPFNPTTRIEFEIAEKAAVNLTVFDIFGHSVKTLVNESKSAGHYSVTFDGSDLSSGIYFYKVVAGNQTMTRKMVLTK